MKAKLDDSTRVSVAIYKPKIEIIQKVVADYYGVTLQSVRKHSRKGNPLKARQRVHYFCRQFLSHCTLHVVGYITGNGKAFDHATISHSSSKIAKEITFKNRAGEYVYPETVKEIEDLRKLIMYKLNLKFHKRQFYSVFKAYRHRCHMRLIYKRSKLVKS